MADMKTIFQLSTLEKTEHFFLRLVNLHGPNNHVGRQVLNMGRMLIIILHELFNCRSLTAVPVAEMFSNLLLQLKGNLVTFPLTEEMQVIANTPEIIESGAIIRGLHLADDPLDNQLLKA